MQRLPDPGHVAVSKDPKAPGKELPLDPVPLDVLMLEKFHDRLGRSKSPGHNRPQSFLPQDRPLFASRSHFYPCTSQCAPRPLPISPTLPAFFNAASTFLMSWGLAVGNWADRSARVNCS